MTSFSGSELASTLHALGVEFVISGKDSSSPLRNDPSRLIAALAESQELRLRLSLIPLFLNHPEFARHVPERSTNDTSHSASNSQKLLLRSCVAQQKYQKRLSLLISKSHKLPDLFSGDLDIPVQKDPDVNLRALALRHQVLSGKYINWLGTYEHGAQRMMMHLERQKRWQP